MQQNTYSIESDEIVTTESILGIDLRVRKSTQQDFTFKQTTDHVLRNRSLQANEQVILSGPVKIKDKALAEKGHILLKERWAVLCPSRILLFRRKEDCRTNNGG